MFLATINKPKQLLYFSYIGHVKAADLQRGAADLERMMADLTPGFRLLADLSQVDTMDIGCVTEIGKTMEALERHQVGLIVRVLPDEGKDIGFNIISAFHYKRQPHITTFKTMQQAAEKLSL